ncbi:ATP-binding protein [Streptomyces sp. NPDC001889]
MSWAVHTAGLLPWEWAVTGALAAGAGVLALSRKKAGADAAVLDGENAVTGAREAELRRNLEHAHVWLGRYVAQLAAGRHRVAAALGRPDPAPQPAGDVFALFGQALEAGLSEAAEGIGQARRQGALRREAEVVASVAPRMHSTVTGLLTILEQLENAIEDPELLRRTFEAEQHATLARRYTESLMVLGGRPFAPAREPVPLGTVLRQATAETLHYRRARTTWPFDEELWVLGYAGPGITHLLAAVIDNGLRFSPKETTVEVRAVRCAQGLLVEVEDHGLSMMEQALATENALLAAPTEEMLLERLSSGRVGLSVVARLAAAYGVTVGLRAKAQPEQGLVASVLIPRRLLLTAGQMPPGVRQSRPSPAPRPAPAAPPAAPPPAPAPLAAAPSPALALAVAPGDSAGSGDRPRLPRRSPGAGVPALRPGGDHPAEAPSPGLAGAFFQGSRRAADRAAAPATEPPA